MLSKTVTSAVQVEEFPFTSVTVKVTVFGLVATSVHVKSVSERTNDAIPQLSFEPLFTAAAEVDPFPVASRFTVTS